ncbi:hypothetical protein MMC07_008530 [Pseudocyphellaria aurata]|nr:hypothetical protein [Pseudocyphellaria aurata]
MSSTHSAEAIIRQSPPLDFSNIPDDGWVKDKTILITGGASGFGAAFLKRWAIAGANVIIGDINVQAGDQLIRSLKKETANPNLHFVHCDVTDWQSQVNFFKEAVKLSPHGGIDTVVANAGIAGGKGVPLERPEGLDAGNPPPPDLSMLNVNLIGVVYTAHLALYWLQRNPESVPANPKCDPVQTHRDRHLLLIASIAAFIPIPGLALYGASKHAVLGLYRCLRGTSFSNGVRINLICPYFTHTPLLNATIRAILAGSVTSTVEDVVEAATRFTADPRVAGRAIWVGPKVKVVEDADGSWSLAEDKNTAGVEKDLWEVYPHDFENVDQFQRTIIGVYNRATEKRGWFGWAVDMAGAISYGLRAWGR